MLLYQIGSLAAKLGWLKHMKLLLRFAHVLVLGVVCACFSPVLGAAPTIPDDRDRQVLETLMLHLLSDAKFDPWKFQTNHSKIVLHVRTPERISTLKADWIHNDIDNRVLPTDAEDDLRRRNTPLGSMPDTPESGESIEAYYTSLKFAAGIVVADLSKIGKGKPWFHELEEVKGRGWLVSYLPGYAKDGKSAIVRAHLGPSAHGATLTALLERIGDKWAVKWYHSAYYM